MKKNMTKITGLKKEMSQIFTEDAEIKPFTNIKIDDKAFDINAFADIKEIIITSKSKGKGFAGGMKRWGFSGGPATHGSHVGRRIGSIGAQGYDRVLRGKKMPGRMGGKLITLKTQILDIDKDTNTLKVNGCIPGGYNSQVEIFYSEEK